MPARVVPTLMEEQTWVVSARARGEAAEEVDAEVVGGAVEGFAEFDGGVLAVAFEEHGGR